MLKHTFLHIPRVGKLTEQKIWQSGIQTWDDAIQAAHFPKLGMSEILIKSFIEDSYLALEQHDISFFNKHLPGSETWRLYPKISHDLSLRIAYLDIETTGMDCYLDNITVIGVYDGNEVKQYIKGQNLLEFRDYIEEFDLLVTFNGKVFDVPVLKAAIPKLHMPKAHIDLRYVLKQINLKGGLKSIERQTGFAREQDELGQLDGYDAILLWRLHQRGDSRALPTLLRYNAEDVVGLKPLLELACNRLIKSLPLELPLLSLSERTVPNIPYYPELIQELKYWQQNQNNHYW
ncbi:MAG: ribonuclease H-like domain-containing protein [Acidobacteria bacterium]|nr:ribonuclease H-like domain-containing protein [Acidobacteriota bacterium]